jgi:hypothetical protein
MQNIIIRLVILFAAIYSVYHYRYRVLNALLSVNVIRKFAVSNAMQIPFVRDRMIQQAFQ